MLEPTYAERARTLLARETIGMLSTNCARHAVAMVKAARAANGSWGPGFAHGTPLARNEPGGSMAVNRNQHLRGTSTTYDAAQTDALLRDLGTDEIVIESVSCHIEDDDVQSVASRLRDFAEENPRIVLGALSALLAGGAVAAGRAVVAKRRSAQKRSAAAAKAGRKSAQVRKAKSTGSSKARKSSAPRASSSKRTLIEPHPGDKRYIRRDAKGRIKESVDVGRSLAADRRHTSKTKAKPGEGDKGDR